MNQDHLNQPPLSLQWERLAAKELAMLTSFLCDGLFINVEDFCDRLIQAADTIQEYAYQIRTFEDAPTVDEDVSAGDPVVLWDPTAGPVRDSELRDVCERVASMTDAERRKLIAEFMDPTIA